MRPHLTEIPIGIQGIGFDRLELDAWVEDFKSRNGRPGRSKGDTSWDAEEDDGYLSAGEIAALKLEADWVILSACNTAAGGAEGAEALSGLASAFFYAGARSLLVSHWAVYSDPTVK